MVGVNLIHLIYYLLMAIIFPTYLQSINSSRGYAQHKGFSLL